MSTEETEGFAKPGTTLEGRVAQLLRINGFKVSRNIFVEEHEVDVFAESEEGKKIIVECKEYYTQLIPRDLILIFATKVRDINPDEAWFVTINDFEPSALELCKRYGIHPINGYDLEELEEKAAEGPIARARDAWLVEFIGTEGAEAMLHSDLTDEDLDGVPDNYDWKGPVSFTVKITREPHVA